MPFRANWLSDHETTHREFLDVAPFGKGNVLPKILSNVRGPRVNIVVTWGMMVFLLKR